MPHQDNEKWAELEYDDFPPGFAVSIEGDELVARGVCPRCQGKTTWRFRRGQMGSVNEAMVDALSSTDVATIVCACGFKHADRPDDAGESGCGAFWRINLKSP